jgi:hypothetical protein
MSVAQGDTLCLHVRSSVPEYLLSIMRQGRRLDLVDFEGPQVGKDWPIPATAWEGCNWPVTARVPIGRNWRPGAYLARMDAEGVSNYIPFVVRARTPGSYGPILVQLSVTTWQAYNRYGGKSLYGAWAPGLAGKAQTVSFERPYDYFATDGSGQFFLWEAPFLEWLESQGYAYEVCTNLDVHATPHLLDRYALFVSVGHDEYYSKEMYDALERFVDRGGNLAFLSGNTLWWQVRFEPGLHTMVCYKDAHLDPLTGIDDSRVTVNWNAPPVNRPPARLMGVYFNGSWGIPAGGYRVVDHAHWVFRGADVEANQAFGYPAVGFEVDARTSDSPPKLDVIARTELPDANNGGILRACEMVYFERTPAYGFPGGHGGKVFSTGSVNFTQGLERSYNGWIKTTGREDPVVRRVTQNVLDRLGCRLAAANLLYPEEGAQLTEASVRVGWNPAKPQRDGLSVHDRLHWQFEGAAAESLDAIGSIAAIPVPQDLVTCRWWVESRSECGATIATAPRTFRVHTPSGATLAGPPQLGIVRHDGIVTLSISVQETARGSIDVFDVAGRRVARFADLDLSTGTSRVDWNLQDESGSPIGAGVYLIRARAGRVSLRRKVVLAHP